MVSFEPTYSMVAVLSALVVGILIGRMTAIRARTHRTVARNEKREAAHEAEAGHNLARLAAETHRKLERLVAEGRLIEAVRICRDELDLDLASARAVVGLIRTSAAPASSDRSETPAHQLH